MSHHQGVYVKDLTQHIVRNSADCEAVMMTTMMFAAGRERASESERVSDRERERERERERVEIHNIVTTKTMKVKTVNICPKGTRLKPSVPTRTTVEDRF